MTIPIMEMNHLLFFAMLVRMLVTNICFILLSILMTCSSVTNKALEFFRTLHSTVLLTFS